MKKHLKLAVLLAVFLMLGGPKLVPDALAAPVPQPLGIVSWWRAQNNAQDSVGSNNGTLLNTTNYGAGKVGTAFTFTNRDD